MFAAYYHRLLRQAVFQLIVVATLGCLLRYKMLFPFPWLEQKHLLHAHSHFAFTGWITQALYILLVQYVFGTDRRTGLDRYAWIFRVNLWSAWGMMIGFAYQGYGALSTPFAGISILVSYWFAFLMWKDLSTSHISLPTKRWIQLALLALIISSIGTWYLAYLQLHGRPSTTTLLLAVYGYLHFQYNGWFLFSVIALLFGYRQLQLSNTAEKYLRYGWGLTFIPAYILSALWLPMGTVIRFAIGMIALLQAGVWFYMGWNIFNRRSHIAHYLWWLPLTAISIKLILQLGSVYPPLSTLAFGIRPIVIGYLHLALLGIITLSILILLYLQRTMSTSWGLWIFITGVILNELLLLTQGAMALGYMVIPEIKYALLLPAALLWIGAYGMWLALKNVKPA